MFTRMSVQENLEMGAFSLKDRSHMADDLASVRHVPRLEGTPQPEGGHAFRRRTADAGDGPRPDEPPEHDSDGRAVDGSVSKLVKEIFAIIRKLHDQGITVLLVEQNANMALSIADRAYVLETGRITMEGDAKELMDNEQVRKAYLGA